MMLPPGAEDMAMLCQLADLGRPPPSSDHDSPASLERQIPPPWMTAASVFPSSVDATWRHMAEAGAPRTATNVAPASFERQSEPGDWSAASSKVPSEELARPWSEIFDFEGARRG